MSKVRNIIRLYTEGVSKQSIGDRTGVMEKALKTRGNTKEKLWQQYITQHPEGYKLSQFKHYYLKWLKVRNPIMHIEHKAGEKMYVDYAGEKLQILDAESGDRIDVEVFVAILGASQLTYIEASYTQQKEDFIHSCERALHYFGGSPNAIVTDNLKSAVTKSNRYEPTLNESFRDFVSHYSMAALPAAPYKPKHKALVEGAVKIIYRSMYGVLKGQVYSSLERLNAAIRKELEHYNNKPLSRRPYSRRKLFEEIERHMLNPLPLKGYEIKRKYVATVMKNNYICLAEDKHYYSVPSQFIGKKATLLYTMDEVEIYHRYERIAIHKRNRRPFGYTTIEEHLASKNRFFSDWNPDKFIERAEDIGQETKDYIICLLKTRQHPAQTYRSCQGVLSFAARVGKERLNNACKRALLLATMVIRPFVPSWKTTWTAMLMIFLKSTLLCQCMATYVVKTITNNHLPGRFHGLSPGIYCLTKMNRL